MVVCAAAQCDVAHIVPSVIQIHKEFDRLSNSTKNEIIHCVYNALLKDSFLHILR